VEGVGGVPIGVWALLLAVGIWLIFRFHSISVSFYASGSNARGAFATGINVDRMKFYAFILNGLMVGLAGLIMTGVIGSGDPRISPFSTLLAILAALIGGASFSGGTGDGIGAIGAAIGLHFTRDLISRFGVSYYHMDLVYGSLILVLIGVISYLRRRIK
jgi:ribose/xylose/arabinose/galactoside ABC-type transport system permease subunit